MVNNLEQSSSYERRKLSKPLIEKRRRERINKCLVQLKKMVLHATGRASEGALSSKLEKADILEMTVKYLEDLNTNKQNDRIQGRQPTPNVNMESNLMASTSTAYTVGYAYCSNQTTRYLEAVNRLNGREEPAFVSHQPSNTLSNQNTPLYSRGMPGDLLIPVNTHNVTNHGLTRHLNVNHFSLKSDNIIASSESLRNFTIPASRPSSCPGLINVNMLENEELRSRGPLHSFSNISTNGANSSPLEVWRPW